MIVELMSQADYKAVHDAAAEAAWRAILAVCRVRLLRYLEVDPGVDPHGDDARVRA